MAIVKISAEILFRNVSVIERRKELGLTQIQAAKFIGLPIQQMARIESLSPGVSAKHLRKTADMLDLDIDVVSAAMPEGMESTRLQLAEIDSTVLAAYQITTQRRALDASTEARATIDLGENKKGLEIALAALNRREREVVKMRYGFDGGDPLTLQDAGDHLNISHERVRQIENDALGKMKYSMEKDQKKGPKPMTYRIAWISKQGHHSSETTTSLIRVADRLAKCYRQKLVAKATDTESRVVGESRRDYRDKHWILYCETWAMQS